MVFGEEQFNVPVGSETWQTDSDTVVVSRLLRRTREFARRYFFSFTEKGGGGWGVGGGGAAKHENESVPF